MIWNLKFKRESELLDFLKKQIDQRPSSENLVAMDADGTLWPEDVNNHLIAYQKKKSLRELEDVLDPAYQAEGERYKRCELFVKKQAGFSIKEFQFHCRSTVEERPLHVFPFQKELLSYLKRQGLKIFIVTASIKWLVEEAVKIYKLPVEGVLGLETKLKKGILTKEIIRPAPLSTFKGEVFLKFNQGKKCFLAGGNTPSDMPILRMAKCPFVVHSAKPKTENFDGESKLKKTALANNWTLFEY